MPASSRTHTGAGKRALRREREKKKSAVVGRGCSGGERWGTVHRWSAIGRRRECDLCVCVCVCVRERERERWRKERAIEVYYVNGGKPVSKIDELQGRASSTARPCVSSSCLKTRRTKERRPCKQESIAPHTHTLSISYLRATHGQEEDARRRVHCRVHRHFLHKCARKGAVVREGRESGIQPSLCQTDWSRERKGAAWLGG